MAQSESLLHRVFRRDIGRKLIALFLAVILFGAIDRQVRTEETLRISVAYLDQATMDDAGLPDQPGWTLFVAERVVDDPEVLVIGPEEERLKSFEVVLRGAGTSIERAREQKVRLRYHPSRPGQVELRLNDVRGMEDVEELLGKTTIELKQPVTFIVHREVEEAIPLTPELLRTKGEPAPGFQYAATREGVQFSEDVVRVRAREGVIAELVEDGSSLFAPVSLAGRSERFDQALVLSPSRREQGVRLVESTSAPDSRLSVTILLDRTMVPIEDSWSEPVSLKVDETLLDTAVKGQLSKGRRLRLVGADGTTGVSLRVRAWAAVGEQLDTAELRLRDGLSLWVNAHQILSADLPFEVPVQLGYDRAVSDVLEVRFVDDEGVEIPPPTVTVDWVPDDATASAGDVP